MTLTSLLLRLHMWLYTRIYLCPTPIKIHHIVWIEWPFSKILNQSKVSGPQMTFDQTSVAVTFVTLPKDHCVQVLYVWVYRVINFANFNKTPHIMYIQNIGTNTYYMYEQKWSRPESLSEHSLGETKIISSVRTGNLFKLVFCHCYLISNLPSG